MPMSPPQWPDTHMPSRATRRRIRLRQDFENSILASDLDEEDFSAPPALAPTAPRVVAAVPPEAQFRREQLLHTLTPPPAVRPPPGVSRPELWAEPAPQDNPSALSRFAHMAAIGAAVLVCGLMLTKGLAEMVWELVSQ